MRQVRCAFAAAFLAFCALPAPAQLFRTYLALDGSDANPCTLAAPCRLLPAALAAVAVGGEIWMLDSANFNTGPVNVTKSVTILSIPGQLGSLVALGGHAIEMTTAGVDVKLRNLNILPFPGNELQNGIFLTGSSSILKVQDCNVTGFTGGNGLYVGSNAYLTISGSTFSGNSTGAYIQSGATAGIEGSHFDNNGYAGILVTGSSLVTRVAVTRSTLRANSHGLDIDSQTSMMHAYVHVSESLVSANTSNGIRAASSAGVVQVTVANNQVTHNGTGVFISGTAKAMASGNSATANLTGFHNGGGTFESLGSNAVRNNGTDVSGTVTVIPGI